MSNIHIYSPVIDKLPMDERFSEDQSRDYFIDLVLGLEFCKHMFLVQCSGCECSPDPMAIVHSQHVIHRDIKPQNLLLDNSNRIKVSGYCSHEVYVICIYLDCRFWCVRTNREG